MADLVLSSLLPLLSLLLLLLLGTASALPLCLNQEAPLQDVGSLSFCSQYSETGCCSRSDDSALQSQFRLLNLSDATCANHIKEVLCSRCDTYAADLFGGIKLRSVPLLCNSSTTTNSTRTRYCSDIWNACGNVSIPGSPFSPNLVGTLPPGSSLSEKSSSNATLVEQWQSENSFCEALGSSGEAGTFCFDGSAYNFTAGERDVPPQGMCFDKVGEDGYIALVPHPDGSNRAFVATQAGQIYLAVLPEEGSNATIKIDKRAPFLDISNFIVTDREFGLMSVAFHPDFVRNGRFFVSYNCDKQKWSGCNARCACNADVGCDPSQIRSSDGTLPCQFSSVISEFSAGDANVTPSRALQANPNEVKRVLTMGLPYTTHHGGLMLFGPQDKYLYFMMGDGGGVGDPFNFAQNKKSLLGKILRLDIDKTPTDQEISTLHLWGKYAIPETNPFVQRNDSCPEIWALGLRNPWRCSFDSGKPEYLYCADVGQSVYEEVNLVTKGGNYGWRAYDGVANYSAPWSPGGNTSLPRSQAIFPVATYLHDNVNKDQGSASITGGYVSRSVLDPCLYGRYVYADLYGGNIWAITEAPEGSGNYSSAPLAFSCAGTTLPCAYVTGSSLPTIQFVYAWGEDNSRNIYLLSTGGTFKIVNPTKCNFACSKKLPSSATSPVLTPIPTPPTPPTAQAPSSAALLSSSPLRSFRLLAALCVCSWMLLSR